MPGKEECEVEVQLSAEAAPHRCRASFQNVALLEKTVEAERPGDNVQTPRTGDL